MPAATSRDVATPPWQSAATSGEGTNPRRQSAATSGEGTVPRRQSAGGIRRALLAWFDVHARDLPWRTARRDPWLVWVSETMLQQTRVEAVIEPYRRFAGAFPTLASLAHAGQADVLARWSGLGYYRRARLLHDGARYVLDRHDGQVPATRAELERVPGIGSYTAGAILSIAFGKPEAALDANVTRVVARLGAVRDLAAGRRDLAQLAAALVRCDRPGDVNEALMDLGSAVCTARDARCGLCPLREHCRAAREGLASTIAAAKPRKPPRRVALGCAVVRDGERVLFLRRPEGDALLAGLWDLPTVDVTGGGDCARSALQALVRDRSGLEAKLDGPLLELRHEIVGRRIEASVYVASIGGTSSGGTSVSETGLGRKAAGAKRADGKPIDSEMTASHGDARMFAESELESVGVPALPVKILRALHQPSGPRDPVRSA